MARTWGNRNDCADPWCLGARGPWQTEVGIKSGASVRGDVKRRRTKDQG